MGRRKGKRYEEFKAFDTILTIPLHQCQTNKTSTLRREGATHNTQTFPFTTRQQAEYIHLIPTIPPPQHSKVLSTTMPYTIHIPSTYQSRTHFFPPPHTTCAEAVVSINASSTLSTAIYNDAKEWGWGTEYVPLISFGIERWNEYRVRARGKGL
jgi:hypothetical protein